MGPLVGEWAVDVTRGQYVLLLHGYNRVGVGLVS